MMRMTPAGTSAMLRWPPVSISTVLPGVEQPLHQRIDVGLQQRLAAGHLDDRAAARLDIGHHLVHAHLAALVEGVRRVAPAAAQVAGRQAHEDARPAGVGRLALDRVEDLVDREHCQPLTTGRRPVKLILVLMLRIGTSGWNYPTGKGTWNGIFYPLPEDRERGFDELRFYSERFNTVEVNSTFYGQPRANASLGWVKRTPADFEFTVKLYQKFTHPRMAVDPGPVTQADVDAFKGGIDPLAAAGKLGPLLVQFPSSFQRSPEAVDYLAWLLQSVRRLSAGRRAAASIVERLRPRPRAARRATRRVGADRRAEVPIVDSTGSQGSDGADLYYLRLHGRNATEWWDHAESEDRYNYFYSATELQPIANKVATCRRDALGKKKAYLFLNNHFSAQSVANAVDAEEDARRADHGAHAGRVGRALPRSRGDRRYFASRTVTLTIRSAYSSLSTTSMPEITLPNTTYLLFRRGVSASVT